MNMNYMKKFYLITSLSKRKMNIYGHENEVYNSMMSFCNVND